MRLTGLTLLSALAAFPAAGAPSFSLPVDCELGTTCFIQNYVDQDPSEGYQDHACGALSYDGHKGTDFALPTLKAMSKGVDILAAAEGVVTGTRDGMEDRIITPEGIAALNGRDCGNGVAIDHGDGWVTQYCHMKRGSVSVATGDKVTRGQPLGEIGLSGRTQFPHLHISIRHNDAVVDPFSSETLGTCGGAHTSLWADPLPYVPGGLIRIGFEVDIPAYDMIKDGMAGRDRMPAQAKALVLFAHAFGSRPGDTMVFKITGPQGEVFNDTVILERTQAQYFRAGGRRTPQGGWLKGTYQGEIQLKRDGAVLGQSATTLLIE
ncbi:M23 family metallopeptidase [Shimia sp. R10_1]|uniref:M23 family metallopeptidase n=1 Tax=Shimia sp. R10_1 TaxID=2821095 RepID=UPI001AD9798C|nr:M23 family metallopeptidase [Shimia sp. R10_1]MBO9474476.1 M23 family metallopeptidase [Shimia sp. R10_1]